MSSDPQEPVYRAGLRSYCLPSLKSIVHRKTLTFLATSVAIVLFAASARGEIFLFSVMLWKSWDQFHFLPHVSFQSEFSLNAENESSRVDDAFSQSDAKPEIPLTKLDEFLQPYHLQHFYIHVLASLATSYFFFFAIGGYLQW